MYIIYSKKLFLYGLTVNNTDTPCYPTAFILLHDNSSSENRKKEYLIIPIAAIVINFIPYTL